MSAGGTPPDPARSCRLRLFVAGNTALSRRAIENLRAFCAQRPAGDFDLEVVDIHQQPELAERHQIVAAPTLLRLEPLPVRRIVGDLSRVDRVLRGLGLSPVSTNEGPANDGPANDGHVR